MKNTSLLKRGTLIGAFISALFLTGCGGGGGGVTPTGGSGGGTPTPCPSGFTGTPPACSVVTQATSSISVGAAPVTAVMPVVNGFGGSITMPSASNSATFDVQISSVLSGSFPVLPLAIRREPAALPGSNTGYLYFTFVTQQDVTLNGVPSITITLPSSVSRNQNFYLAGLFEDGWGTIAGPGTVSGNSVTITGPSGTLSLPAGYGIALAFYAGHSFLSGPPLIASPSPVQLLDLTASQIVTVADSDPSATISFDASLCNGIAGVSQTSNTTLKISAIALGACNVAIADSHGNTLTLPVSVTSTSVVVQ